MSNGRTITRRRFVGQAVGVAGAFSLPWILPQSARGANDEIVRGHIAVGNRGKDHVPYPGRVAAVCDVDRHQLDKIQQAAGARGPCEAYTDFRRLLDRKDIDAVVICPPDHWHALMVIAACRAGKHVYVEKPLSLTIVEGRRMVEAARKTKRVVQVGSQQRTDFRFAFAAELARSGRLGRLQRIEAGLFPVSVQSGAVPDREPPDWLDYDAWLGPAPYRPYNPRRVHVPWREWRWCWDYSGGNVTNWGAHHLDIAQWGMGTDDTGPVEIEGTGEFDREGRFSVPARYGISYRYSKGVVVAAGTKFPGGVAFIGSRGRVYVDRGKIAGSPDEILKETLSHGDLNAYQQLYRKKNHLGDWLDCIRTGKSPVADIEIGHRSVTVCHLGNTAIRLGRKIRWDPAAERIIDDDEAQRMLSRPYRGPWSL